MWNNVYKVDRYLNDLKKTLYTLNPEVANTATNTATDIGWKVKVTMVNLEVLPQLGVWLSE